MKQFQQTKTMKWMFVSNYLVEKSGWTPAFKWFITRQRLLEG
jgi:hypothetical protein